MSTPRTPTDRSTRTLLLTSLIATSPLGGCVSSCPMQAWETGSTVVDPDIVIDTSPQDAGVVWVGQSQELSLEFSNAGRNDLVISALELSATGGPFHLSSALPEPLAFDGVAWIELFYRPVGPGPHGAILTLHCNDPYQPVVSIPVTGEGLE